jgi:hypothetical protein
MDAESFGDSVTEKNNICKRIHQNKQIKTLLD